MAYTIIRSDGTQLTTIQDGTINTVSTSLGLPGRNYSGWGQTLDTNFVRMLENFSSSSVPPNPLRGQLWFNTSDSTLRVCPADGTLVAADWLILSSTNNAGDTTLGNLTVTGNITTNNLSVTNATTSDTITVRLATVTANLSTVNAAVTTADVATLNTRIINAGSNTTTGNVTGVWSFTGNISGNAVVVNQGNLSVNSTFGII